MPYLLDTNVLVALTVHDDRTVARRLRIHRSESLLSVIVMHELYFGAYGSRRREDSLAVIDRIRLPVLLFEPDDAKTAAAIRQDLRRQGRPIGAYDTLIAGQALARGLTVVTRNLREYGRVEGLSVEDWS